MKIDLIAGARPNFVKIAALIHANMNLREPLNYRLIHTGQHYDEALSGSFFRDLKLPVPDINLDVGSCTQAEQTGAIMVAYEKILQKEKPGHCIVVGDVTSSMACAITAKKMQVKVAHVEAGIRSHDWSMPEEVNRVLIDSISDYLFTTSLKATHFLKASGHAGNKIFFVGNTMIDTLLRFRNEFKAPEIYKILNLKPKKYLVLTLHRPGNVDKAEKLKLYLKEIIDSSRGLPVIFPAHPRTANILQYLATDAENFHIIPPLGYLEFNFLVENSKAVITDSGGITEEATFLGVPCITIRNNTERPETVERGTNELIGTNPNAIAPVLRKLFEQNWKKGNIPELWDGKAGERIIKCLLQLQ